MNNLLELRWGFFTITHIITLILAVIICIVLLAILRKSSKKTQDIVLLILSTFGPIAIVYNLVKWGSPLEYLPFHMCSINAILCPIAVLTKNKTLTNLLILWCFGAVLAVVLNTAQAGYKVFSVVFVIYYFPHIAEFFIPIAMFKLKKVKLDPNCIPSTLIITFIIFTIVHLINVVLNQYFVDNHIVNFTGNVIQVNYMYTFGNAGNPVLDLFFRLIPYKYFYMLLTFPIILLILLGVYMPAIIKEKPNWLKLKF